MFQVRKMSKMSGLIKIKNKKIKVIVKIIKVPVAFASKMKITAEIVLVNKTMNRQDKNKERVILH